MGLTQAVRVWQREAYGVDAMGDALYRWSFADVDGVLVRPASANAEDGGADTGLRPDGVAVKFVLALPKGYDGPPLRHARVTLLNERYGMDASKTDGWRTALEVSGDPMPVIPCPTRWDTLVEVGRRDG